MKKRSSSVVGEEWIVGLCELPGLIRTGDEHYRVEVLVWIGATGQVLGQRVEREGTLLDRVLESFEATVRSPLVGAPRRPSVIRTESAELSRALRRAGLNVVEAFAPEVDVYVDAIVRSMSASVIQNVTSYLASGATDAQIAGFFSAAAELCAFDPWDGFGKRDCVGVTIGASGARERVVEFSEDEAVRELWVFDDAESLAAANRARDVAGELGAAQFCVVRWMKGSEVSPALRKEAMRYGWKVAAADAFPVLIRTGGAPLTARDFELAEVVVRALSALLGAVDEDAIDAAFTQPGATVEKRVDVAGSTGSASVLVRFPIAPIETRSWLDEWSDAEEDGDVEALCAVNFQVLEEFVASPEGEASPDQGGAAFVLDFLADPDDPRSIAAIDAVELFEIVVGAIPMVSESPPGDAPKIVEGLRAFYRFLQRQIALPGADECIAALGPLAEKTLADALANRGKKARRSRPAGTTATKKRKR